MDIKEKIKNTIVEKYNKLNHNSPDYVDLNKPAKDNEDPFFKEYRRSIIESVRLKNELKNAADNQCMENLEKCEDKLASLYGEDEEIEPELINKIELKVNSILKKLKIEFFENSKEDLKKLIIQDVDKWELLLDVSQSRKEKIFNIIGALIEHEIVEYKSKKEYRKKELLKDLLQKINPLVNSFFEKNNYDKLIKMTLFQRKNLVNYFFENLNHKYIQSEFLNKSIDEMEFKFLKSKVHSFIITRYEKILSEKLQS